MSKAREIDKLDCAADARESAVMILNTRFKEIVDSKDSALDFSDIEGVHNMRVAARRLRSALRDFAPLLDKRPLKALKKDIKQIADALGAVRDQDVAILVLEKFASKTESESVRNGVDVLLAKRAERRDDARTKLTTIITAENLDELQIRFAEAIKDATDCKKPIQRFNLKDFGNAAIKNSWRDLQKLGVSLYAPFDVEKLHKMRITAKRLRYAVELFAACEGESLKCFADEIAEMQSFLGDVHDCDVWIEELSKSLKSQHKKQTPKPENYQAAIRLLSEFTKKRTKKYRAALKLWKNWQDNFFAQRLRATVS